MEAVYVDHSRKLLLLRRRSFDRAGSMAEANAEHRRLLESILAGDAARARQQAEQHTRSGRARFLTAIAYREDAARGLPEAQPSGTAA
jgi:DNA-binding GntR family transcriptional regulator